MTPCIRPLAGVGMQLPHCCLMPVKCSLHAGWGSRGGAVSGWGRARACSTQPWAACDGLQTTACQACQEAGAVHLDAQHTNPADPASLEAVLHLAGVDQRCCLAGHYPKP